MLNSWQRRDDSTFLSWNKMADRRIYYVVDTDLTHIECLPNIRDRMPAEY